MGATVMVFAVPSARAITIRKRRETRSLFSPIVSAQFLYRTAQGPQTVSRWKHCSVQKNKYSAYSWLGGLAWADRQPCFFFYDVPRTEHFRLSQTKTVNHPRKQWLKGTRCDVTWH